MTAAAPESFETAIAALTKGRQPRVWSLVVSLFGDLAQNPGDELSGAVLSHVMSPAGIRPEALRVALHRLRQDNWIESHKAGRASLYALTPEGRAQSAAASPIIYAEAPEPAGGWRIALLPPGDRNTGSGVGSLLLSPRAVLLQTQAPLPSGALVLAAADSKVPDWVFDATAPDALNQKYKDLDATLLEVEAAMQRFDPTAQQIATLRTLIVHSWRRLVLSEPRWPRDLYPEGWSGHVAQKTFVRLLASLPKPDIAALEDLADQA